MATQVILVQQQPETGSYFGGLAKKFAAKVTRKVRVIAQTAKYAVAIAQLELKSWINEDADSFVAAFVAIGMAPVMVTAGIAVHGHYQHRDQDNTINRMTHDIEMARYAAYIARFNAVNATHHAHEALRIGQTGDGLLHARSAMEMAETITNRADDTDVIVRELTDNPITTETAAKAKRAAEATALAANITVENVYAQSLAAGGDHTALAALAKKRLLPLPIAKAGETRPAYANATPSEVCRVHGPLWEICRQAADQQADPWMAMSTER